MKSALRNSESEGRELPRNRRCPADRDARVTRRARRSRGLLTGFPRVTSGTMAPGDSDEEDLRAPDAGGYSKCGFGDGTPALSGASSLLEASAGVERVVGVVEPDCVG